MKSGIGAVIAKDQRVISTGYNGTPAGLINCNQGGCRRCNGNTPQGKELDKCLCLHAEESAIIEAGRPRTIGATLYTTHFPCLMCTKKVIQAGILRVVYYKSYDSPLSWEMLAMANIEVVQMEVETGVQHLMKKCHQSNQQNQSGFSPSKVQRQLSEFETPILKRQKTGPTSSQQALADYAYEDGDL